jgi:tetratricopeptide (TPR) repeat protein
VRAFTKATDGVPFLVRELLKALAEDGVRPTVAAASMLDQVNPRTVTRATMLRLARLGPIAIRAAQGIAVLGATATPLRLANLTDVPESQLKATLDALVSARILRAVPALEFVHPLVQTSVYEDIPPSVSSAMHAHAASLLAAMHSDPEQIAAHLLSTGLGDDPGYSGLLVDAADTALARGAPDAAATYLRHALQANPGGDLRGRVLFTLGRCEQLTRDPAGISHLRAAIEALHDPSDRAQAALVLGDALLYVGDLEGSRGVLDAALDDLAGEDRSLAVQLEALSAHVAYGDPRFNQDVQADMSRLRRLADRSGSNARALNVFLSLVASTNGENGNQALPRLELGLDHGRLLKAETSDSIAVAVAVNVLVFIDELERADQLAVAMIDDARRRGLVLGFIAGSAHRGLIALRKGALAQA